MNWNKDHDPFEEPLGCNGKPGESGLKVHARRGESSCDKCRYASNHARRERKRGQPRRRPLEPCGTRGAAQRHRSRREKVCFPCRVAEAEYNAEAEEKTAKQKVHQIKRMIEVGTPEDEFMILVSILLGVKHE